MCLEIREFLMTQRLIHHDVMYFFALLPAWEMVVAQAA
jgi:hypothetical protein